MFIVRYPHPQLPYVVAPAGYCRTGPDTIERDGTCPVRSGPEVGAGPPWIFSTHRSAARQAAKCLGTVELAGLWADKGRGRGGAA